MDLLRGVAALLGVVLLAGACSPGSQTGPPAGELDLTAPGAYGESSRCLAAQGARAWRLQGALQRVTSKVLGSPGETRDGAAAPLRHVRARIERPSQRQCGSGRTPLVPLVELAYRRDDEVLDEPLLREIVDAFEEWAMSVRVPRARRIIYHADPCVPVREGVRARYVVHREAEPGGSRAWVEIRVANEWGRGLFLEHGGTFRATGVRPGGGTRTYQWGGSSADSAAAPYERVGRTAVWPSGRPDRYVHLLPGGRVRVFDVYGWVNGVSVGCRLDIAGLRGDRMQPGR